MGAMWNLKSSSCAVGVALATTLASAASADEACDADCSSLVYMRAPLDGEIDVPLNVRLLLDTNETALSLRKTADPTAVVPMTGSAADGRLAWATPAQALEPSTSYEVVIGEKSVVGSFTTGTSEDSVAPVVASSKVTANAQVDGCGSPVGGSWLDVSASDDRTPEAALMLEIKVGDTSVFWQNERVFLSAGDVTKYCHPNLTGTVSGSGYDVEVVAYDRAGNASPSSTGEVTFPTAEQQEELRDDGCSLSPTTRGDRRAAAGLALLLGAGVLARRLTRRSPGAP